jgi:hypothetical protein
LLRFLLVGNSYADSKPTVTVLDFESIGSEEHLGKAVSEIMRTELIGANQFRVVERAQINKTIAEQKLQKSGIIDDKSAVELGKLLGALIYHRLGSKKRAEFEREERPCTFQRPDPGFTINILQLSPDM